MGQNEDSGKLQHTAKEGNLTRNKCPQQQISAEHEKRRWTEFVLLLESRVSFVLRQGGSRGQREVREHRHIHAVSVTSEFAPVLTQHWRLLSSSTNTLKGVSQHTQ